jgi:NAD+ synthetase
MALIYVNQVGGQDDLVFDGRSLASDAQGTIFFKAPAFLEGLFTLDWTLGEKKFPLQEGIFQSPTQEIYKALVLGLRDYVRKNGFSKVVLGLSGGIDSSLVAVLAHDALGPEAILGMMLPGPYSSKHSVEDAEALGKNLGIRLRTLSITSLYRHFQKTKGIRGSLSLADENLQARLRGLELMYLSNREGYLLLTTGNKSEMAMGYCTLYGDMCGGLGVIGDVYKTEVYRLCRYRNRLTPVIPERVLKKAPSAELRPHQKDTDSLPPYELLDEILYHYIEKNKTVAEMKKIFKRRASEALLSRIVRAVDHNEYKRRQSPPVLRVTEKAWFGRRMPITNRFVES